MTRLSIRVGGRQRISHASSFHFIPRTSSGAQASAHSRPTPPPPPPLSREWRVVSSGSSAAVKGSAIPRYSSILPPISLENYVDESPNSSSPLPLLRYHSTRNTLICNSPRSRIGESNGSFLVSELQLVVILSFSLEIFSKKTLWIHWWSGRKQDDLLTRCIKEHLFRRKSEQCARSLHEEAERERVIF